LLNPEQSPLTLQPGSLPSDQIAPRCAPKRGVRSTRASPLRILKRSQLQPRDINPVSVINEIHRVLKTGGDAWIYDPAKVVSHIDKEKWRASLSRKERFFLWLFTTLKLLGPIKTLSRQQAAAVIQATNFTNCRIDREKDEIKIRLWK